METERAPGSRALITRGPAGSAVRSNIAADGTGLPRTPAGGPAAIAAGRAAGSTSGGRAGLSFGDRRCREPRGPPSARSRRERAPARCRRGSERAIGGEEEIHGAHSAAAGERCLAVGGDRRPAHAARPTPGPRAAAAGRRQRLRRRQGPQGRRRTSRSRTSSPASSTSRWSSSARTTTAAGARPTTRASSTSARTCPARHVAYVELVPEGADSEQVFRSLSRKGFNFIIGTSFGYMDPMETVAEGIPGHHVPAPDRLQVERQELRQLLRRGRGLQVPRRHARRLAGEEGRQPEDRLHGDLPDPRGAPPRQRDHARRQA